MNIVDVCIFEDRRFSIDWDISSALKCNAQRTRTLRGWTFRLHEIFCPENELTNPQSLPIDSEQAYNKANGFVSEQLVGYGCLFFDCKFKSKSDGIILHLTEGQLAELAEVGTGEIHEDAFPGPYLALRAAKSTKWQGVIAIASSASNQIHYEKFINKLKDIAKNKRIVSLGHSLADYHDVNGFGRSCEVAIEQLLIFVGARSSPKDRLHPPGTESWFAYDVPPDDQQGRQPHRWLGDNLWSINSPAGKSLSCYLANLFGCTESDSVKWIGQADQGILHGELKKSLGACAKLHAAKDALYAPTLVTVLLAVAACFPNPIMWIRNVRIPVTEDVFNTDCSPEEAKQLFYALMEKGGLFQSLFVWDRKHCSHRRMDEPVIVDVQISCNLLKVVLHDDFEIAKLAAGSGDTKRCLDKVNEDLRKGSHPLSIKPDKTENAVVFEAGGNK